MHTFIDTCVVGHYIVLAIQMLTVEPLLYKDLKIIVLSPNVVYYDYCTKYGVCAKKDLMGCMVAHFFPLAFPNGRAVKFIICQ